MKKAPNFPESRKQLRRMNPIWAALLLLGTTQFMVGCYSYKPMTVSTDPTTAPLKQKVSQIRIGRDYEVVLKDGKKMETHISAMAPDAIIGKIELRDAEGDKIYSPSGKVVSDPNYSIPLDRIADIRERKLSVGKTIIAIAIPATALLIVIDLLLNANASSDSASKGTTSVRIGIDDFNMGNTPP